MRDRKQPGGGMEVFLRPRQGRVLQECGGVLALLNSEFRKPSAARQMRTNR